MTLRSTATQRQLAVAALTSWGAGVSVGDYLQDRYVMRDWSVGRPCTELGVGHGWLDRS